MLHAVTQVEVGLSHVRSRLGQDLLDVLQRELVAFYCLEGLGPPDERLDVVVFGLEDHGAVLDGSVKIGDLRKRLELTGVRIV